MKRIPIFPVLFVLTALVVNLVACAPAVPAPTATTTAVAASPIAEILTFTPEPSPTPVTAIDIIRADLTLRPEVSILGTNPHGVALTGAELDDFIAKRAEVDKKYSEAIKLLLIESAGEGKWQAEYLAFFGRSAPDVNNWDNLTIWEQMDAFAAYLRVPMDVDGKYGDGLTAVNVPAEWMRVASSSPDILFPGYNENGMNTLVGYKHIFSQFQTTEYEKSPEFRVFGQPTKIMWRARELQMGIRSQEYINPVIFPGQPIDKLGVVWVYMDGHATFVILPFAVQKLDETWQYPHGTDSGVADLFPGNSFVETGPFMLNANEPSNTVYDINAGNSSYVWEAFAQARKLPNIYIKFVYSSGFRMFMGLDAKTKVTFFPGLDLEIPSP